MNGRRRGLPRNANRGSRQAGVRRPANYAAHLPYCGRLDAEVGIFERGLDKGCGRRAIEFRQGLTACTSSFGQTAPHHKVQQLKERLAADVAGDGQINGNRLGAAIEFEQQFAA